MQFDLAEFLARPLPARIDGPLVHILSVKKSNLVAYISSSEHHKRNRWNIQSAWINLPQSMRWMNVHFESKHCGHRSCEKPQSFFVVIMIRHILCNVEIKSSKACSHDARETGEMSTVCRPICNGWWGEHSFRAETPWSRTTENSTGETAPG